MVCKSQVNHLHLHVQTFYIYTYHVAMYINIFSHLHKTSANICQIHFTWAYVHVLRSVNVSTKMIL